MNAPTQDARQRLLDAAAEVFASKGYAAASTREICRLAGTNVAAIHYYFGDKASLYREIFKPTERFLRLPGELDSADVPLKDALIAFYRHMLSFASAPRQAQHLRLLFGREQLQPSGVLDPGRTDVMRPFHAQLLNFLASRLGTSAIDLELHRLAFSLVGVALVLIIERGSVDQLAPALVDTPGAIESTARRLADSADLLIEAERRRRAESGMRAR